MLSVRPFPDVEGVEWEVATNAWEPLWAHDGRQLFCRTRKQAVAMEVVPGLTFITIDRRVLFPNTFRTHVNRQPWDVSPDGRRVVTISGEGDSGVGDPRTVPEELIVAGNFFDELNRRVRPR